MSKFPLWFFFLVCGNAVWGQQKIVPQQIQEKMQWFEDAKLGIFIHQGIYSVNGIDESWSFHNRLIRHSDYMKQLTGFTMAKYKPAEWADVIKNSGAKYAVITTKHHDGVALYHSRLSRLNTVDTTPAGKDIIQPLFQELRQRKIKCGAYYSLIDWTHWDYPGFLKDSSKYILKQELERWKRFLNFYQGQIQEINQQFKPDLWWFDGDWEHSADEWQAESVRKRILAMNPDAIINGRLSGYGDYETPEQNFPVSRPPFPWWELCMTSNDHWGYQADSNWKTPDELIRIFADVISNGGNLLLDMGPKADGSIPEKQKYLLNELGAWIRRYEEAIFSTKAGLPLGHFYGPSTISKDSMNIYLFVSGGSKTNAILKGLSSEIEDIENLYNHRKIKTKVVGKISWSPVPGIHFFDIPAESYEPYLQVIRIRLKNKLKLYRGQGGLFEK
jgi:alpha-L-fucosidase